MFLCVAAISLYYFYFLFNFYIFHHVPRVRIKLMKMMMISAIEVHALFAECGENESEFVIAVVSQKPLQ